VGQLDGKVAVVTGAGRGIGRAEALLLASEGATVVVNDVGCSVGGEGTDDGPAQSVVDEIQAAGGTASANGDDVATWDGGERLVSQAIDTFGGLDILVNNAGVLRDRMSFNMDEAEWDTVVRVHLKGHFCPTRFAAAYWRQRSKRIGGPVNAKIVNTSSDSGLYGNAGQVNYAAAKAGIAAMTVVLARELQRCGVRVNAIAPVARTRLLATVIDESAPVTGDELAPEQVAAVVGWLVGDGSAEVSGHVFRVRGRLVQLVSGWHAVGEPVAAQTCTSQAVDAAMRSLVVDTDPGIPRFPLDTTPPA
jgi:NAD(P)-dependent dehydrogenase (short-subunit alcohol dehydrogenase family)